MIPLRTLLLFRTKLYPKGLTFHTICYNMACLLAMYLVMASILKDLNDTLHLQIFQLLWPTPYGKKKKWVEVLWVLVYEIWGLTTKSLHKMQIGDTWRIKGKAEKRSGEWRNLARFYLCYNVGEGGGSTRPVYGL